MNEGYINSLVIETGNIFDIGFRMENDTNETPDDLFMSDGPWGADDSAPGSTITVFTIEVNEDVYSGDGLRIERNVNLIATTSEYVSVYRSFTAMFKPVDLSEYNTLEFDASGTGVVEIAIIKSGIDSWENQFKTTIILDGVETHYVIPYHSFLSPLESELNLNDAVTMVFTMSSDGVTEVGKEINLKNIEFTSRETLGIETEELTANKAILYPNPMSLSSQIRFYSEVDSKLAI
ncbi:MAG: hypothetical protein JKY02_07860, partial [Flavobacteriaceae bacterium]|nr:hypothetical protein [Flavobacteriaceae bacterium]